MTAATARDLALQLDLDRSLAGAVRGDPLRVRQIVNNYLGNAIKFTPRGLVLLRARRGAGDKVRIEVHDSGEGIDARGAGAAVPTLHAGRRVDHAALRRHRPGPVDLPRAGRPDGRRGRRRQHAGAAAAASGPSCRCRRPAQRARRSRRPWILCPGCDGARVLMVEDNAVNMLIAVAMLERWGCPRDAGRRRPRGGARRSSRPPRAASPSTPC
jgi:hypothetical protein